jgi:hypothetical protein
MEMKDGLIHFYSGKGCTRAKARRGRLKKSVGIVLRYGSHTVSTQKRGVRLNLLHMDIISLGMNIMIGRVIS